MKRFGYALDPLALGAIALYALNRWLLKPHLDRGFMHDHFNDLLLVPAALPLILGVQRWLGWRTHDAAPTLEEILVHLIVWTLICEAIGPHWLGRGIADAWDVVAYVTGAGLAKAWWAWRASVHPGAKLNLA